MCIENRYIVVTIRSVLASIALLLVPADLLLQHDAVDARLEQGEHQAGLALELAEPVEDLGRGLRGHSVEDGCELCGCGHQ